MSSERLVQTLRARWRLIACVWLCVVATVAIVSLRSPPRYVATVSVMVEPRLPDPSLGMPLPYGMPNHIPTEIDVVQSERVALSAVHALGLQNSDEWRDRWTRDAGGRGDFEAWLAAQLLRDLDVRPSRESNVLSISFQARDPARAAQIANAITQAYIQTSAALHLEPARQQNASFDESAKRLRDNLAQAQARLSAYQQQHGLVGTDDRLDVENLRLTELNSRVVALQTTAAQASERRRQADLNKDGMDEVQRDPAVLGLSTELTRLEGRLTELTSRMGEQHPAVIEARASIADVRTRLAAATQRASRGVAIESRMASDQLAQLQRAMDQQRAKILALKAERDGAQVLQREVDNAQRAYDTVLTRYSQTAVESRATRPNVSILKKATEPARPKWPHHGLNLAASALIGLLLAVLAALWRERRDRRLRCAEDVTELIGQLPMAILPAPRSTRRLLPAQ